MSSERDNRTVRHIHLSQELRDGRLVTLEHAVFERGMAEARTTDRLFDRDGWLAWLARESDDGLRHAA